ncbi:Subtilisin-like protease SBT5.3, partial [Thalictrum thalictroides]
KLIGARYFNKGYKAVAGSQSNASFESARDSDGHGTHTLSTAGGNFVSGANVFGLGNGTAKGGSPKARVAAYKVCWPPVKGNECLDADIMAGFDAAIHDGVDVLSVSLGGDPVDYFKDAISIGSFHAFKKGIVVVSSAGNSGPKAGTVCNISPWMLTVGASTMDREFPTYVALGNKQHFKGQSLSSVGLPAQKFYPLIISIDAKASNASALDA